MVYAGVYLYFVIGAFLEFCSRRHRQVFTILCAVVLILIAGMRGMDVGADYDNYAERFYYLNGLSLTELFDEISTFIYEPLYTIINVIIGFFGGTFWFAL